jgi:Ring finger domain
MGHMVYGGCMEQNEEEVFCQPVNLAPILDTVSDSSTNYSTFESSSIGTECCICWEVIGKTNNCVTECGHAFCFKCLVTAMAHNPENQVCPYCRSTLVESPKNEEDDDDDSEWNSDDEDEDDDDEEEGERNIVVEKANVEEMVVRLEREGITMLDVVSLLFNKFSKTDAKYTMEHIEKLCNTVDKINDEVEKESQELEEMGSEDVRA